MFDTSKDDSLTSEQPGAVAINMGVPRDEKKIPHSEAYGDPYWVGTCYSRGEAAQQWEILDP
jgi:hypothetical protein